jgi:hypothetical protein
VAKRGQKVEDMVRVLHADLLTHACLDSGEIVLLSPISITN